MSDVKKIIYFIILFLIPIVNSVCIKAQSKYYLPHMSRENKLNEVNESIYRKNKIHIETVYAVQLDSADTNLFKIKERMFDQKGRIIQTNDNYEIRRYTYNGNFLSEELLFDNQHNLLSEIKYLNDKNKLLERIEKAPDGSIARVVYEYDASGRNKQIRYTGTLYSSNQTRLFKYAPSGALQSEYTIINVNDTIDRLTYSYFTLNKVEKLNNQNTTLVVDSVVTMDFSGNIFLTNIYKYGADGKCFEEIRIGPLIKTTIQYDKIGNQSSFEMAQKSADDLWIYKGKTEYIRDFSGKLVKEIYFNRRNNDIGAEYEYEYYTD